MIIPESTKAIKSIIRPTIKHPPIEVNDNNHPTAQRAKEFWNNVDNRMEEQRQPTDPFLKGITNRNPMMDSDNRYSKTRKSY